MPAGAGSGARWGMDMKRLFVAGCLIVLAGLTLGQADSAPKVSLMLEDQFEHKQDLATRSGDVVVLLYGDRDGMPANKDLGEKLHLHYHPTAKGLPPDQASKAP